MTPLYVFWIYVFHQSNQLPRLLSVVFMIKLINGDIDSSFLLSRINFHITSRNLRVFVPIQMNNYRSNFLNNTAFMLMCKHFNDL